MFLLPINFKKMLQSYHLMNSTEMFLLGDDLSFWLYLKLLHAVSIRC